MSRCYQSNRNLISIGAAIRGSLYSRLRSKDAAAWATADERTGCAIIGSRSYRAEWIFFPV